MIIAEIGWNFLGNLDLAKEMIVSAKNSGCKTIKFQLWNPKNLKQGPWDKDGRREIYNKAYLNHEKYKNLYEYCKSKNLDCFASVFNMSDYKILKDIDNCMIKIPSTEAYDLDLIKKSLDHFQNVYVSTGAMKFEELELLKQFKKEKNFIILHCVSIYPLQTSHANFEKFKYLQSEFEKVGYSGHCEGINDAIYALSLGAYCVEKHFTTSNDLEGRDNKFAITPDLLKTLCKYQKDLKNFNIKHGLNLQENEMEVYQNYRGRWKN